MLGIFDVGKNVGVLMRSLAALLVSTGIAFAQFQQPSPANRPVERAPELIPRILPHNECFLHVGMEGPQPG